MEKAEITDGDYLDMLVRAILANSRYEDLYAVARQIDKERRDVPTPTMPI